MFPIVPDAMLVALKLVMVGPGPDNAVDAVTLATLIVGGR